MRALLISMILAFGIMPVHSQILSTITGSFLIDKAGDEVRDSISHARDAASVLIERANEKGKERLEQIDLILKKTVGDLIEKSEDAALKILNQAKKDIDRVQASIVSDLKSLIWEAECAGRRTTIGDLNQVLGGLGVLLKTHQIRLSPPIAVPDPRPWYCKIVWWCADPNVVDILEPFGDTYIAVRDKMELAISSQNIKETTPAHRMVGTYEYMSSFALKTSCFYPGSNDVWNREYLKYREAAQQWRNLVQIAVR